ncbi:hypothetical protein C8Q75DRAFT_727224, partial [Abortiporus biennis]
CRTFKEMIVSNSEKCSVGGFVLIEHPEQTERVPIVARILEILQLRSSTAESEGHASSVLVETFQVVGVAMPYRLPRLRSLQYQLLKPESLICCVNVQHNCAANKCKSTASHTIRQERETTTQSQPRIRHLNSGDLLLNTAQMRNSIHLQSFRIQAPILNQEQAILEGATREIKQRKLRDSKTQKKSSVPQSLSLRSSLSRQLLNALAVTSTTSPQ